MNIFIDELLCFVEGWFVELTQVLFLELSKEVLDRRIVPAVARRDMEGVMLYSRVRTS